MKRIVDVFGFILFILFTILILPYLFIVGGIKEIMTYFNRVVTQVKNM